jgi:N-acyl-L-homoserine lactone synthetase
MFTIRPVRPDENGALFRGRYDVYVEEMQAMPPRADQAVRDRFDDLPGTCNLVVVADAGTPRERLVGGARWVVDIGHGTTADPYYDFTPHLPTDAVRGAGSMLWMKPEARGQRGLIAELMAEGLAWCLEQGISHVLATVNPPVATRFARVGYRPIGSPFQHSSGLPVQPMILETGVEAMRRAA